MGRIPPAVRGLVLANAIVFVAALLAPGWSDRMDGWFAFWFPRNEHFAVWQVVTYMFMHGGFAHIFFNMFALASFGLPLEHLWGTRRFLVFYFVCGVGAALVQVGINWVEFQSAHTRLAEAGMSEATMEAWLKTGRYLGPLSGPAIENALQHLHDLYHGRMVGASGAIYGILVAFGLLFPNAKLALLFVPVPVAAKFIIPALLAVDLLSGVTGVSLFGGGTIAHFAHLGGALIGFLLMWYWRNKGRGIWHGSGGVPPGLA